MEKKYYDPLVEQFFCDDVDMEAIAKIITHACKEEGNITTNTLLLATGLLHKDEPIEAFGQELWSGELVEDARGKVLEEIRCAF